MTHLSVITPIYNEEDSVRPLYDAVVAAVEPMGVDFEILFVDDGSSDESVPRLEAIAAQDPRVAIVKFRRNAGQTAAMTAGIDLANGEYLVTMDGDLQNDPADIPMMLERLKEGHDLVVGWRIKRQDAFIRRKLPSMVANFLIGKVTGLPIRDNGCSLKAYRADVIKKVPLYSDMHRFIPAMTIPLGARVGQVGVRHHARQFGESKYGLSRIYKVLLDMIAIRTILMFARRPLAAFWTIAGFSGLAAVFAGIAMAMAPEDAPLVVHMSVFMLFASLSAFLLLLGPVAMVAFSTSQGGRARALGDRK